MEISLNNRHKAGLFLTAVVAGFCLILGENFRETLGGIIIGFALTWAFGSTNRSIRCCIGGLGILLFLVPFITALTDHFTAVQNYEQSLKSFRIRLPQFAKEHPDLSAGIVPNPNAVATVGSTMGRLPIKIGRDAQTHRSGKTQAQTSYGGSVDKQPTEWDANGNPIPVDYDSIAKEHGGVVLDMSKAQPISRILTVPDVGNVVFPVTMSDEDIAKALRADSKNNPAPEWYLEALDAGVSPDDINQLIPAFDKLKAFDLKHVLSDGVFIEVPSALLAILFFGSLITEKKISSLRSNGPIES